jgi:hypothetical protein
MRKIALMIFLKELNMLIKKWLFNLNKIYILVIIFFLIITIFRKKTLSINFFYRKEKNLKMVKKINYNKRSNKMSIKNNKKPNYNIINYFI